MARCLLPGDYASIQTCAQPSIPDSTEVMMLWGLTTCGSLRSGPTFEALTERRACTPTELDKRREELRPEVPAEAGFSFSPWMAAVALVVGVGAYYVLRPA